MQAHQSVLLQEAVNGLNINPDGVYMDATFGRGGHSQVVLGELSSQGRLIAIDKDLDAIEHAGVNFKQDKRFHIVHSSFAGIKKIAEEAGLVGKINGVLFDLGVSSPQLDNADRGFSFMRAGPLDMRMDRTTGMTAADFVNKTSLNDMVSVFREYGEERYAPRIARALIAEREESPITTTERLAAIVKAAHPKWEKHKHPATRVFQAIRIYINRELEDLKAGLQAALEILAVGGRLVVISFHSLEDRIVKQFMKRQAEGMVYPKGVPVRAVDLKTTFKCVGRAIKPSLDEVGRNVRARSAVMRIGEKLA